MNLHGSLIQVWFWCVFRYRTDYFQKLLIIHEEIHVCFPYFISLNYVKKNTFERNSFVTLVAEDLVLKEDDAEKKIENLNI